MARAPPAPPGAEGVSLEFDASKSYEAVSVDTHRRVVQRCQVRMLQSLQGVKRKTK